ncbi:unnamed protein product [Pedinophyceae sp. YPF-701]|nr:unnamed protein product [Pedinophyceae sp. YPF-701]
MFDAWKGAIASMNGAMQHVATSLPGARAAAYLGAPGTEANLRALAISTGVFLGIHLLFSLPPATAFFKWYFGRNPDMRRHKGRLGEAVAIAPCRIAGFVHHVHQIVLSAAILTGAHASVISTNPFMYATELTRTNLAISTGYFLYDMGVVAYHYKIEGPAFLIHSLACSSSFALMLLYDRWHYWASGFLLYEVSSPIIVARWFMKEGGVHTEYGAAGRVLYALNGACALVAFLGCRIVWGTYFTLQLFDKLGMAERGEVVNDAPSWAGPFGRVSTGTLLALNFFWTYKLVVHTSKPARKSGSLEANGKKQS